MEMLVLLGDNFPEKTSQHCLTCGRVRIFTEISEECCGLYQVIMCFHHIERCPTLIRLVVVIFTGATLEPEVTQAIYNSQVRLIALQIDKIGTTRKTFLGRPVLNPTYTYICI